MAESRGPRSNPLFEGGAPSNRAPTWAKNASHSSDKNPYDPPADVDRSNLPSESPSPYNIPAYEPPGYTVETPGLSDTGGASPYHAPPYFINTSATSDRGSYTPYSSAPSSPRRYTSSAGEVHTNIFVEEGESSGEYQNPYKKRQSGGRSGNKKKFTIEEGVEFEEEFPDDDRDHRRWVKQYTCIISIVMISFVALCGLALFVLWTIFQPVSPKYKFLSATVDTMVLTPSTTDGNGVSTYAIDGSVTVSYSAYNPNTRFKLHHDSSLVQVGYSKLIDAFSVKVPSFDQSFMVTTPVSVKAVAVNYPLYGGGPAMQAEWDGTYVSLSLTATFYSHVNLIPKFLVVDFTRQYGCIIGLSSTTLTVLNTTCTSSTNEHAFDS